MGKFIRACESGDVEAARLEMDRGIGAERINRMDGNDVPVTPLHIAAASGHTGVIALLLDRGVKVDITQKDGATPLMAAVSEHHLDAVNLLLRRGANPNVASHGRVGIENGPSALTFACQSGYVDEVEALLNAGASVEQKNGIETPLETAIGAGQLETVKFLIRRGAQVHLLDSDLAVHVGHKDIAAILLQNCPLCRLGKVQKH
jgi:ankyrin repeat protein